jgi:hypothetical protein
MASELYTVYSLQVWTSTQILSSLAAKAPRPTSSTQMFWELALLPSSGEWLQFILADLLFFSFMITSNGYD